MTKGLKHCPFCGSEAEFNSDVFGESVCCKSCGATLHNGVYGEYGRKLASVDWNARPIEDAQTAEIARLREALDVLEEAMTVALSVSIDADSFERTFAAAFERADDLKGCEE